jgi:predicted enzyme related to lactoylglutathione lyase
MSTPTPGTIGWIDLTVEDNDRVKEFYAAVTGWRAEGCDMGGYADYSMIPPSAPPPPPRQQQPEPGGPEGDNSEGGAEEGAAQPVAGVCRRTGPNADVPAGWMIYIVVEDIDAAATLIARDPEGNAFSLWAPPKKG